VVPPIIDGANNRMLRYAFRMLRCLAHPWNGCSDVRFARSIALCSLGMDAQMCVSHAPLLYARLEWLLRCAFRTHHCPTFGSTWMLIYAHSHAPLFMFTRMVLLILAVCLEWLLRCAFRTHHCPTLGCKWMLIYAHSHAPLFMFTRMVLLILA
jgi:hypothetical protein